MIYLNPSRAFPKGYHVFQVYDEPAPGETEWDPSTVVAITREELVKAIHDIDLHSNVVMADEVDEDPPPCDANGYTPEDHAWLPAPGQRVRVVWRYGHDAPPFVGDVIRWMPDSSPAEFAGEREPRRDDRCVCGSVQGNGRLMRVVPA